MSAHDDYLDPDRHLWPDDAEIDGDTCLELKLQAAQKHTTALLKYARHLKKCGSMQNADAFCDCGLNSLKFEINQGL